MKLSIIYVHYKVEKELNDSIKSITSDPTLKNYEIIVVDNSNSKKLKKTFQNTKFKVNLIAMNSNIGFGAACNIGASIARGDLLLFLNPDTIVRSGSISKMIYAFRESKKTGAVGPKITNINLNRLQSVSKEIKYPQILVLHSFLSKIWFTRRINEKFLYKDKDLTKFHKVEVIGGACMLIRAKVFEKIKGFDEKFFMYFEEHDLCNRIRLAGYDVIYFPESTVVHLVGSSLRDKKKIQKYFQKSRFEYSKKYFGFKKAIVTEIILRYFTLINIILAITLVFSLFLNTYQQDTLMLLIGDAARDFLAARDMILLNTIPWVGIPSSVVWLHQGPTSIWLIALSFIFSNFNPIAPAILFGVIGAFTTFLVFIVGKNLFDNKVGLISAILYSCAPNIVVNARMPYHTSLVPFFTLLFFMILIKSLKNNRLIPLMFFSFGLLLLVELSNIVILGVIFTLFYICKIKFNRSQIIRSVIAFCLGILPFIIYEVQYGPSYLKFPLWIINRIRISLIKNGIPESPDKAFNLWSTFYQQITGSIIPQFGVLSFLLFFLSIVLLIVSSKRGISKISIFILLLWVLLPLFSFALHSSPGTAYFSLVYPGIVIAIGYLIITVSNKFKFIAPLFIVIALALNSILLINNDFFVTTSEKLKVIPPTGYSFGYSWKLYEATAKAIVKDAKGSEFRLVPGSGYKIYKTSIDPLKFMIWKEKGLQKEPSNLRYEVSLNTKSTKKENVIYKNTLDVVKRYE